MIDPSLSNLAMYSAQVFALVLAAAGGARLLHVPAPSVRFAYWRAVVAGCLTLPLLALLAPASTATPTSVATISEAGRAFALSGNTIATPETSLVFPVLWLLAVGIVLRALWLSIGLTRLRRWRLESAPIVLDEDIDILRRGLALHARLATHRDVQQPITFGFHRPIVLLPRDFSTLPIDTQRAVVCHELLHVQRGDWLWALTEELVRAVFWYHPAMRWALNQVQLGREELVDARVVELTGAPRTYMNALLTFANRQALAPATLFARPNQLARRIRRIAEEVRMSRTQVISTGAVLAIVLAASTWVIASAMPLSVTPGAVEQAAGASTENIRISLVGPQVPKIATQVRPEYPPDLLRSGVGATITLTVVVNATGRVTDVRDPKWQLTLTEGSSIDDLPVFWARKPWQAFVEAAGTAINQWTFEPSAADSAFPATVVFQGGGKVTAFAPAPPPPPPPAASVEQIKEQMEKLRQLAERLKQAESSARGQGVIGPVAGSRTPGQVPQGTAAPPPPPPPPPPPVNPVFRVGGGIKAPLKIHDVRPIYPESARAAGVAGIVIIETHIAKDGTVANVQVLRSIPLLDDAALEAVRQWQFTPTLLNGEPIEVMVTVTVNFTLQ